MFLSGIVHVLKSGGTLGRCAARIIEPCPAISVNPEIKEKLKGPDPKKNYYNRFVRWAERGVWEEIFAALAGSEGEPDRLMIDSTFIKNHRCSGGGKGGPSYMLLVAAKADGQQKFTS